MREMATVNYHVHSAETQAFHVDVDGKDGKLIMPEFAPTHVQVEDVRRRLNNIDFESHGVTFAHHESRITEFQSADRWREVYNEELRLLLKDRINAKEVIVFDHTVRVDDLQAERRPARHVHNDFSAKSAKQCLVETLGAELAREYDEGHYAFVNVWRPVEKPVHSAPLAFIRPDSMSAQDWMTIELYYPDRTGQVLGVARNEEHDWFYLSAMSPNEVAIFNTFDNQGGPVGGHSALDVVSPNGADQVRKSVESRTLVLYH
ncbi:MAG: CmcJ/NvfI family oxidoreductase [Pseudomonadota bacterium]